MLGVPVARDPAGSSGTDEIIELQPLGLFAAESACQKCNNG
jgi:hypothetical protein